MFSMIHSNFRKDVYAIIASLDELMPEEARIDAEIMHLMCIVHQAREISGFLNEHRLRILMKRINDEMMRHSRINYYIGHFLKAGLGFRWPVNLASSAVIEQRRIDTNRVWFNICQHISYGITNTTYPLINDNNTFNTLIDRNDLYNIMKQFLDFTYA